MKIKTELLKELIDKAMQCVGNNKLIPITQLMGIKASKHIIRLTTTDATNYMFVTGEIDNDEEIEVTVFADQFSKLIGRMTSEYTYLKIIDGNLEVKGNGTYTLGLPLNEEGELISYPNPLESKSYKFEKDVLKLSDIKVLADNLKPSLATTLELPIITNYYVGDAVMSTNRNVLAYYDAKILVKEVVLSLKVVDLLVAMNNDIQYYIDDEIMLFESGNVLVYSKWSNDADEFPVDALSEFMQTGFKSVCKVNKNNFIALLERIALFVGKYDKEVIRLYFEKDGIRVSNKDRSSNELIEYVESKKFKAYDCPININMLLTQLKAYAGDTVEIHYNNDKAIKLVGEKTSQIIALVVEK